MPVFMKKKALLIPNTKHTDNSINPYPNHTSKSGLKLGLNFNHKTPHVLTQTLTTKI